MKRNPLNTNQLIHQGETFNGIHIQTQRGAVIENNLVKAYDCFTKTLSEYARICLIRFDLQMPKNYAQSSLMNNSVMARFFASLKQKINYSQDRSRRSGNRVHDTNLRYIWCREFSDFGRTHYHVAILLNHQAYAFVGEFNLDNDNMYSRIHAAWASALSMHVPDILGLVHFPVNPVYQINRDDPYSLETAFHRVSYLCKMETKEYGLGFHSFGCSRN